MNTPAKDIPQVDETEAAKLVAQAHAQADVAVGSAEGGDAPEMDKETLDRLSTPPPPDRMTLPPTPLEDAMAAEGKRAAALDADWLRDYPAIAAKSCIPSEDDKVRFTVSLLKDEPFLDLQTMLGGKFSVEVRMLSGTVIDALYEYLKPARENSAKDPFAFADELQRAGAACQVLRIMEKSYKPADTVDEIRERVKEFRAMQNQRWTAILLAVRQANIKGRMLAEMIVNFDADFSKPDASA